MLPEKKEHPKEKTTLHPRNKHRERYDFKLLIAACPDLASCVKVNIYQDETIDFADPKAVKMLNKALLKQYYGIENWAIPPHYLCPPIPSRADYVHYLADVLAESNDGKIPTGAKIKVLDIGVGANAVYPIIGQKEYAWSFIATDIDPIALENVHKICENNPILKENIVCRLQKNPNNIFIGVLQRGEKMDLTICNPPFFASKEEAEAASIRKIKNLTHKKTTKPKLNFGGQNAELWCEGGEELFIRKMIGQSREFKSNCLWFSTLVSKETTLKSIYQALNLAEVVETKTIKMAQGNKISRIVAWTFLNKSQQKEWLNNR